MEQLGSKAHTLRLRDDALRPAMRQAGIEKISTLQARMGMSRYGLDRVIVHRKTPGPRFVASLCVALDKTFDDLFEIVPESATEELAAIEARA